MGYYSEVGFIISVPKKETADIIRKDIDNIWFGGIEDIFNVSIWYNSENYNYLIYRTKKEIKWYKQCDSVSNTMGYLTNFIKCFEGAGVHFLRIGEDYTDIEEIFVGEPKKLLTLIREIKI